MTQQDKNLLIKDICARLPYWPQIKTEDDDDAYIVGLDDTEKGLFYVHILEDGDSYDITMSIENFKPYLRPMSSMTKEERNEWISLMRKEYREQYPHSAVDTSYYEYFPTIESFDYLNSHHFDYRGLIDKGLALEAPEGIYKI